MTDKSLLQRMKKNDKPYGLLETEEQTCFLAAATKGMLLYYDGSWKKAEGYHFTNGVTYRIALDFQYEPSFIMPPGTIIASVLLEKVTKIIETSPAGGDLPINIKIGDDTAKSCKNIDFDPNFGGDGIILS